MTPEEIIDHLLRLDNFQHAYDVISPLTPDELLQVVEGLKREVLDSWKKNASRASTITNLILNVAEWQQDKPLVRALCLQTKAILLVLVDRDYKSALRFFDESNAIYAENDHELGIAVGHVSQIWAMACLQQFDRAFAAAALAKKILIKHNAQRTLSALENNLTAIYIRNGQDSIALERIIQVENAYKQLGEEGEKRLPLALINRAFVLRNLGRYQESLEVNQEALDIAKRFSQKAIAARAKLNFGITYFILGQFTKAQIYLQDARDLFLSEGLHSDAIIVELFISNGYLQLRQYESVLEKCQQVRELFQTAGTHFEVAQALLNEATALAGLNDFHKAHIVFEEARQLFMAEKNVVWQLRTDLEEAKIYLHERNYLFCKDLANKCLARLQPLEFPYLFAHAQIIAAWSTIAQGIFDEGQDLLEQARDSILTQEFPTLSYQYHYLNGEILAAHHQFEAALIEYETAINELEKLQGQIMVEFRADFLTDKDSVYASAVDLCLDLEEPKIALNFAERAKSRALVFLISHQVALRIEAKAPGDEPLVRKILALREKRDRLYRRLETGETPGGNLNQQIDKQSSEAAHVEARKTIIETEKKIRQFWHRLLVRNAEYSQDAALWQIYPQIDQSKLNKSTLLIEYFRTAKGYIAFLISAEDITAVRLSVSNNFLSQQQQFLWHNFNTLKAAPYLAVTLSQKAQQILRNFYQQLIEPFVSRLAPYTNLIIVPHGSLHNLPFHAFFDGKKYLLNCFQISYLPSSSLLGLNQTEKHTHSKALVIAHDHDGRLPHVVKESKVVAEYLNTIPYVNGKGTRSLFQKEAPESQIIHIASHADFRQDNPLFSGLHLSDGLLTTLDIFNLKITASLVTLSACQTGRGVISGGDELLGLMRAFMAAGTASLLLSLWLVEDEITAEMMQTFYSFLKAGKSKIAALQQTQKQMIDVYSGKPASHPFFWAPFFLVGDSGRIPE